MLTIKPAVVLWIYSNNYAYNRPKFILTRNWHQIFCPRHWYKRV